MGKHHINTLRRIRLVLDIVEKHYEPGNNAKNYYNSGKLLLVPYTKDFGIITRF